MPGNHDERPRQTHAAVTTAGLYHNRVSWIGGFIGFVAGFNILFFFLIGYFSRRSGPYIGIFTWIIFPAFLILGLLLFFLGMGLERRRRRKHGYAGVAPYPRLDFNVSSLRYKFLWGTIVAVVFLLSSGVGSYQAYQFSESEQFCGTTCHVPMHPEFTAYQASPHARVRCVDCHVGSGAGWYVRAKWNGAHQLLGVMTGKYPRPIPTPVRNLRPASDTCEQCHWPERYIGEQVKVFTHFSSDEKNTVRQVRLLLKTGGGSATGPLAAGIHWHMNIANRITYIATDPQRQNIPWVRLEDAQGHVTEYKLRSANLTSDKIAAAPKRLMDCIDCHSRPAHVYTPPDTSVDLSMLGGRIDPTLPNIKNFASTALTEKYDDTPAALRGIANEIDQAYHTKYPDAYRDRKAAIDQAIAETQSIFERTIFPEMKVDWRTHPNNIGHLYSAGCFRCHDGDHVSADGKVVRKDCNLCHTVLDQQQGAASLMMNKPGAFQHPVDLGDLKAITCTDCHTGGVSP